MSNHNNDDSQQPTADLPDSHFVCDGTPSPHPLPPTPLAAPVSSTTPPAIATISSPTWTSPPTPSSSGESRRPLWGSASAARLVDSRAHKHRSFERLRVSKQVSVAQRSLT